MSLFNRQWSFGSRCSSAMIAAPDHPHADPFRQPLQPRQPVPCLYLPDLPPSLELDFPLYPPSRFPISSIRQDTPQDSSAKPPAHPPKPIYPRHDPLYILSQTPPPPPRVYPDVLPAPSVAPGVLADGVLTAKHPSVRNFLDAATIAPPERPPLPADKRVLALVALSVFYHPLHPAHWAFWNREQKEDTAQMIQSVLDTTPTPILSPIGWMDVRENLWILKSVQAAYAPTLASLPWYATYTPAEPESRMNLRKRKRPSILPSATNGASGDETVDEEEKVTPPPRKRARARKSTRARSSANAEPTGEETKQGGRHSAPEPVDTAPDASLTVTKDAKHERIESPDAVISATVVDESTQFDPPEAEEAPEPRKSLRQQERKARAASLASPPSTLATTPARGLSQARSESSAIAPESVGGGESGSSTAVSLFEEQASKSNPEATKTAEEVADGNEAEEDDIEGPVAKKPRVSRTRARGGSRARTAMKNKVDIVTGESETNVTVQARPKARSKTKTRRR